MTIDYIKQLLLTNPIIKPSTDGVQIDFIGERATSYSIESEPTQPIIKQYMDGSTVRQFAFSLVARLGTITDAARLENSSNYETLALWLEAQSRKRALPSMPNDNQAMKIEAVSGVFVIERAEDANSALYVMQCALTYLNKGVI